MDFFAGLGDEGGASGVGIGTWATASSARRKGSGNVRPRLSARRRIPKAALRDKKYRGAIGPRSSVSDKEHALPPLRHVEELAVQSSPLDQPEAAGSHTGISPSARGRKRSP